MLPRVNLLFLLALAVIAWVILCYFSYIEKYYEPDTECGQGTDNGKNALPSATNMKQPEVGAAAAQSTRYLGYFNVYEFWICVLAVLVFFAELIYDMGKRSVLPVRRPYDINDVLWRAKNDEIFASRTAYLKQKNLRLQEELKQMANFNCILTERTKTFVKNVKAYQARKKEMKQAEQEDNLLSQNILDPINPENSTSESKFQQIKHPNICNAESKPEIKLNNIDYNKRENDVSNNLNVNFVKPIPVPIIDIGQPMPIPLPMPMPKQVPVPQQIPVPQQVPVNVQPQAGTQKPINMNLVGNPNIKFNNFNGPKLTMRFAMEELRMNRQVTINRTLNSNEPSTNLLPDRRVQTNCTTITKTEVYIRTELMVPIAKQKSKDEKNEWNANERNANSGAIVNFAHPLKDFAKRN